MCLKGMKQFSIQSVIGSIACSTNVGSQQGVTNGLWKALEKYVVKKAISKVRNIKTSCTIGSGY